MGKPARKWGFSLIIEMIIKMAPNGVCKLLILLIKKMCFIEVFGINVALYIERPVMVPVIKQNRRVKC